MIARQQLVDILPAAKPYVEIYIDFINMCMMEFDISTKLRQAAFISEIGHESRQLACVSENLMYSAGGLMKTWPKRFPTLEIATQYARQPEKIANKVYANRMGNGDEASGDGWLYRGAGLIELTGKENHIAIGLHFNIPLDRVGEWLRTAEGATRSAGWFWKSTGCNVPADKDDFDGVCDLINIGRKTEKVGDAIGYAERLAFYKRAKEVLNA